MTTTSHDIPGFAPAAEGFAHAASASGRLLLLSGQTGQDSTGAIVEGGLGAQLERALLNVGLAVRAGGGDVSHLVRLRVYVVDWNPSKLDDFMAGGAAAFAQMPGLPRTAVTLIGVHSLFTPEILVEVEAEAVVPAA